MKSVLDGYLTEGCKECPDWSDGTDKTKFGIGCCCSFPIDWCPYFKEMMQKEERKEGA